jgi:hypothetical protein
MPGRDVVAPYVASVGRVGGITITLVLLLACALMFLSVAILGA